MLDPGRLLPPRRSRASAKGPRAEQKPGGPELAKRPVSLSPVMDAPPLLLLPLLDAAAETSYSYLRCLHVWHLLLSDEDVVSLVGHQ